MKISLSCKHEEMRQAIEDEVERLIPKVQKLLKHYAPDLVQLHGLFEKQPRKGLYGFSLNLSLPTGTLHATSSATDGRVSVRQSFTEMEGQLKKHQARVRKDYEWKRKRGRRAASTKEVSAAD
jgi:ribosome-associated translation inhibitor RaiA